MAYDLDKLKSHLAGFKLESQGWKCFFEHFNITPIRLCYEDAVHGYPGYLAELFAKTGIKMVAGPQPRRVLKTGDAVNDEFVKRLRRDLDM